MCHKDHCLLVPSKGAKNGKKNKRLITKTPPTRTSQILNDVNPLLKTRSQGFSKFYSVSDVPPLLELHDKLPCNFSQLGKFWPSRRHLSSSTGMNS